ncbi:MAG: AAA family ATPase [Clostridiales bacterium]|nr:AAA family ATPase [Clostridiales bacterium]
MDYNDYKKLHDYVKGKLILDKMNYVFLDEIQLIPHFQLTVDSLFAKQEKMR